MPLKWMLNFNQKTKIDLANFLYYKDCHMMLHTESEIFISFGGSKFSLFYFLFNEFYSSQLGKWVSEMQVNAHNLANWP
jgi:hypothetical protein